MTIERSNDNLMRLPEVKTATTLSRSTIYRKMKAGTFPQSVPISDGLSAWYESDIKRWKADPPSYREGGN